MIFMLASVVLIMRNWELVEELRSTMEAERRAAELARSTSQTNATLEEQLAQTQHQLSELRMQLMQAEEADLLKSQLLDERQRRVVELESLRQQLERDLLAELSQREKLARELQQRSAALEQQQDRLEEANQALATLQLEHQQQSDEVDILRQNEQQVTSQLGLLQGEYDQLKVKYDKLVKPARTAKGKHVVEVRYERIGKRTRITFKGMEGDGYHVVQRKELEKQLDMLKKRYPKQLYVKIIIPEQSGLSYNEAWEFMKELLDKYDYYYQ
jgi:chromosome segregation ATPase